MGLWDRSQTSIMETGTGPRELFWYLGPVPETNRDCELLCALLVVFSSNGNISFRVILLIPISLLNLDDVLNIHVLKLLGLGEDLGFCLLNLDFHLFLVLT